jgi:hypothetical protein
VFLYSCAFLFFCFKESFCGKTKKMNGWDKGSKGKEVLKKGPKVQRFKGTKVQRNGTNGFHVCSVFGVCSVYRCVCKISFSYFL